VHKLFARQLARATNERGSIDLELLTKLVVEAYEQAARDRRRTDRSIALMIEELDQLNRELERLVEERTAELRKREAELQAQNLRFDVALNNMSQALVMFDAEARLVICNQRYNEMYRMPPEWTLPGTPLVKLLELRRRNGTFSRDPAQYIDYLTGMIAQGKSVSLMVEEPDGRTISILNQPMVNGGWVSTHEDITERRRAEKQIAHMARHDSLTDLPNRLLLREKLSEALTSLKPNQQLAVLYLDLDHFKGVNDTLGHGIGDTLLKAVADRLRACVRDSGMIARDGGDEFAIVQAPIKGPNDAAILAKRVCDAVKLPYDLDGQTVIADSSIGIAIAPEAGSDPDELIKNADMALYRAKAEGRGTYRFFERAMDDSLKERHALELALRGALAAGEFELHYQPLVDLESEKITCCEALIRWRHPERGLIAPAEFIPIAEEIGLIVPIGEWVLRRACTDAMLWPNDVKLAVNLSPIQVMNQNLVPMVVSALASTGMPAWRLEVEITESVLMQNSEATLEALHRLRQLGVRISLDDFGTGYSSLSYLRRFPFDKIKIDRCFISDLKRGDESAAIVRAIAGLAYCLNMITTAEGVETGAQMQLVRELGCTEMQGYHFSPPQRIEHILRLFFPQLARRAASG
jgi:diguanylate cyclase (GGDEF)-like protein